MQRPSSIQGFLAWACAATLLLMGCGNPNLRPPRGLSTVTEVTPGDSEEEVPASWQTARVGDRVEYAFYADLSGSRRGSSSSAGQLFVEVVAVRAPWVWLSIRVTKNDGQPHPHPMMSHDYVLPMRMGKVTTNVPRGLRGGTTTRVWAFAVGRHWDARRTHLDHSLGDGPVQHMTYAVDPGPLYLTRGLLEARSAAMGYSMFDMHWLTLVSFQRGSGTSQGTVPAMDRPWGPGTWYELSSSASGSSSMERVCMDARQGYLLRKVSNAPKAGTRCEDFRNAEVVSLEDALIDFVKGSVYLPTWPPRDYGAPLPRQVRSQLGQQSLLAYFEETPAESGVGGLQVRFKSHASDVWSPVLRGLPMEARFERLAEGKFWLPLGGPRRFIEYRRLTEWGTWMPRSEPAPGDSPPP